MDLLQSIKPDQLVYYNLDYFLELNRLFYLYWSLTNYISMKINIYLDISF